MALDLNDKTANGNTLTNNNGVTELTGDQPFANSTIAARFATASSQFFSAAESASLEPTGNFTIEAWVRRNGAGQTAIFQNRNDSGSQVAGISLELSSSKPYVVVGKNTGVVDNTDYHDVLSGTTLTDNTWTHLAVVYNGSTIKIYINGVEDSSEASSINPAYQATTYPRIGASNTSGTDGSFHNGDIDEVRLWNIERTVTEIADNMSVELVGNESGLVAYWPFESAIATTTSTSTSTSTSTTTTSTSTTTTSTSTTTTSTSSSTTTTTSTSTSTTTTSTSTTTTSTSTTTTSTSSSSTTSTSTSTSTTITTTSTTTTWPLGFTISGQDQSSESLRGSVDSGVF